MTKTTKKYRGILGNVYNEYKSGKYTRKRHIKGSMIFYINDKKFTLTQLRKN